jgi:hypothetical protein
MDLDDTNAWKRCCGPEGACGTGLPGSAAALSHDCHDRSLGRRRGQPTKWQMRSIPYVEEECT